MPSGPKKRKAAKKKKQKENNINNLQGNDELKSQDEKGSDGGEVSSPEHSSPEHSDHDSHLQIPFNEGREEVEGRDPPAAQPIASDAKCMEEISSDIQIDKVVGGKEDSVVLVEGNMKSEESSDSKDVSFEHIDTAKESCYGNENAGGTSNDESVTKKNSKGEDYNSIEEAIVCHEFVKSVDSSPSNMTLIAENATVEETGNSAAESSVKAVASLTEAENDDNGSVLLEKSVVHSLGVTDLAMKINEDHVYPLTYGSARTLNLVEPKPKECDSEVLASLSGSPFTKSSDDAEHIKDSETPECSENQPLVASAPHMVQKTSWLSCCGLFEVVSGSDR